MYDGRMSKRPFYLGIDLGTTNSAAAVFDGERITVVRNAQGGLLTPSIVRLDGKGSATVGTRAARFLDSDARNTRSEFKRLMGTATALEFPAAKAARLPEELAAEVLRSLRSDVKEQLGVLPEQAVISVPALFELPQSSATTKAAQLAGFTRVELIQEPIASALAAGWTASEGTGHWLVYDLGGGTFDASLLETRDGLLRVVGHDGDNFLGGRDFDWAIVDWAIEELNRRHGLQVSRSEPRHAAAVRKLKLAAEEAKIELTRAETTELFVSELLEHDGAPLDLQLTLGRAQLEALTVPLVQRSIEVCQRLLTTHRASELSRIVLVGGPTVMPWLRQLVGQALRAPFAEGLDPMTVVAQGAAVYAATSGLEAAPQPKEAPSGHKLWLQHPAMSSDLTPYVVGKLLSGGPPGLPVPQRIRITRSDGLWQSADAAVDVEGAFALAVELLPRRSNVFRIEGFLLDGQTVPVTPGAITIVQGLTISDPPLSRTIGVARANDTVQIYFERGTPLPARRTITHQTIETVAPTAAGAADAFALKIPIVQGEYERAHLCRLVGTLEISSAHIKASLPAGAQVQVSLELDRGGQLSARALVPSLGQVFEQVAHLLVPEATPVVLEASIKSMRDRLAELRTAAFRQGQTKAIAHLSRPEQTLVELERDVAAAKGGDADAGQKARRSLLELDAMLDELEAAKHWPELNEKAARRLSFAGRYIAQFGTPAEQRLFAEMSAAFDHARQSRNVSELQRQLRLCTELGNAAYYRDPSVWEDEFEWVCTKLEQASDQAKAQSLLVQGQEALKAGDKTALRDIVEKLWKLLPSDPELRRQGYDSGVR